MVPGTNLLCKTDEVIFGFEGGTGRARVVLYKEVLLDWLSAERYR